jgi:hypothetical protein
MGGDLAEAPADTAPTFMVRALRDLDGANLDRIQTDAPSVPMAAAKPRSETLWM